MRLREKESGERLGREATERNRRQIDDNEG